jgi:5-methylcytosine-specific restriction endonuclease McrA
MDRRAKATVNRDKAARLNAAWSVGAVQARYSDDGHWYATLERFPAALFDANGFVLFPTKADYEESPHLRIGKQISVPKPGISAIPAYVRVADSDFSPRIDVDIHSAGPSEGSQRLVLHLQRERNRSVVRKKKRSVSSLDCEVCGFSFAGAYGGAARDYCEVHHLVPLSGVERTTTTRMVDLAVLCANCHRVVHLRNPPYTLDEVKSMLAR